MKTIIAAIDFSNATKPVVGAAAALARATGARIVLVHVIQPAVITSEYSPVLGDLAVASENSAVGKLAEWKAGLTTDGLNVETSKLCGQPDACIREEAERLAADYIVIGSHGHGAVYNLVVGSAAGALLKRAPCPVLVVPAGR